jgi:asparagine synthase (glutamine-hydrolysing)
VTAYRLSALETAAGVVLSRPRERVRAPEPAASPRAAFDRAILPALRRGPCLVSFSGGRDSSAVLAAATLLARREGLPLPIPATHRFPAAAAAGESEWQEQVVAHLGLTDWIRIDCGTELDCVGPVATAVLRRHGLLWPSNVHFHVPIIEAAAGGSVLTGIGGDEAFGPSAWGRAAEILSLRARPRPRDARRIAFALAPRRTKRRAIAGALPVRMEWLRPDARREVAERIAAEAAGEPVRWRPRYDWLATSPYLATGIGSLELLGADSGVRLVHPFHDRGFLAALGALPRRRRFSSRAEAMALLVGDALPPESLRRATKASFGEALWSEHSRAFVDGWDGAGVDGALVDSERLRAIWRAPLPDAGACTLLQSLRLASPN